MIEADFDKLSRAVALLPTGVIVGSAVISRCEALRHEGTEARSEGEGIGAEADPLIPAPPLRACVPLCLRACTNGISPTYGGPRGSAGRRGIRSRCGLIRSTDGSKGSPPRKLAYDAGR